ncbi:helix-turn-helix domain-containing protein [Streptomyces sp. ATCC 21386]|uniref:helix-turn-helix domain-containing protein n=1 Tax=Streptomyces sp. ATCC 21386 TaxID=2699428 RepID=UPI001BFFC5ED|nr:helix-turn-helix domain-containing protein [Streptomyces sp. ATCC 21386]
MSDNKAVALRGARPNLAEHKIILDREGVQYAAGHFTVVPRALIRDPELTSDAKVLWQLINDYAGSNRMAFPSHKKLADDMGKSVASIKRYIDELIRNRWLTAQNRIGTSNYYYCAIPMEHYKAFDPKTTGYTPTHTLESGRGLLELPPGQTGGSSPVS